MLLLADNTDKLQLITSAAGTVHVFAEFADMAEAGSGDVTPGRQLAAISTATTTDIVATPGTNLVRKVKKLHIRNAHASVVNDVTVVFDNAGTDYELHKVTLQPGEALEYVEGVGFFTLAAASTGFGDLLMRMLDSDATGSNVSTAQPWFPSNGAVAVEAGVTYDFDGAISITRSAGTTSHTTGIGFGGTATLTYINFIAQCREGDVQTLADSDMISAQAATNLQVKAASTSATEAITITVTGGVKINAAGTFIPQFTYSAAPGGAPTIEQGSYFRLRKLGAAFQTKGTWT